MQNLKISLVQSQQFWEDKEKNLAHFDTLLSTQINEPTDVIVFPEMFHTGFTMNVESMAESMAESPGIKWLQNKSNEYQALCFASLIIKENGCFYNRMVAVQPDGTLDYYDKIHLFTLAKEHEHFTAGSSRKIVNYKGWNILLQVCYDLRFPENARNSVNQDGNFNFDLIVYVANWPERRISHWDKLLPARAIENQCYVAAVNRVGTDANNLNYNGSSQLLDGLGNPFFQEVLNNEFLLTCELNFEKLMDLRHNLPFLKDRK